LVHREVQAEDLAVSSRTARPDRHSEQGKAMEGLAGVARRHQEALTDDGTGSQYGAGDAQVRCRGGQWQDGQPEQDGNHKGNVFHGEPLFGGFDPGNPIIAESVRRGQDRHWYNGPPESPSCPSSPSCAAIASVNRARSTIADTSPIPNLTASGRSSTSASA